MPPVHVTFHHRPVHHAAFHSLTLHHFGQFLLLLRIQLCLDILNSLKKTNKIIFFDEDVPGGATAFMMQKVIEEQGGFQFLDAEPRTLTGSEHRPAYSTDGDYFSNPNAEDVFDLAYSMMNAYNPNKYPRLY